MKTRSAEAKTKEKEAAIEAIRESARRWPSSTVPRTQVPRFTGYLYSVGHMANCDSRGDGVPGAFRIGRKKIYPIDGLVEWLVKRLEV